MDSLTGRPERLDGGLATTLQTLDDPLPPDTPVEPWLISRPDAIRDAHAAFVAAGAEIVCTSTFMVATRPDWRSLVPRAVDLARESGAPAVWLALGPVDTAVTASRVVRLAARTGGIDGVVLETVVDAADGLWRLADCRQAWDGPLVLSVVPEGGRSRDGQPLNDVAQNAMARGATGFGLNCVSGPLVERAVASIDPSVPLWLKPTGDAHAADAIAHLWARATWFGGCCGTRPADLVAWWAALES